MPDYNKILITELENGRYPDFFLEEEQILSGTEYDQQATAYIKNILSRIPLQHVKAENVQIFISGNLQANACAIPLAKPPIIIVTKGLLELAGSEDEVAGVLTHELMHIDLHEEFPYSVNYNSKVEESACDCASIDALDKAGYKRDGLIDFSNRFKKEQQTNRIYRIFEDPHPSWEQRRKNLSNLLAGYERDKGLAQNFQSTPLPEFIAAGKNLHLKDTRFLYYLDKQLHDENYQSRSTEEKILLLAKIIRSNNLIFEHDFFRQVFNKRVTWLLKEVKKLKINVKNIEERLAFGVLMDAILICRGPYAQNLLQTAYEAAGYNRSEHPPFGILGSLQHSINKFIESKDVADAEKWAERILKIIKENKLRRAFEKEPFFRCIDLKGFAVPKVPRYGKQEVELPWNQHVTWAKDNKNIRETLDAIGILNTIRIYDPAADELNLSEDDKDKAIMGIVDPRRGYKFSAGKMVLDKVELLPALTFSIENEMKRVKQKEKNESGMAIDWKLFDKSLVDFLKKYEKQNRFEHIFFHYGFSFAERVMDRIKSIAVDDPARADKIFSDVFNSARGNGVSFQKCDEYYNGRFYNVNPYDAKIYHGISINHPYIQYAFENFEKYKDVIPYDSINYFSSDEKDATITSLDDQWLFKNYESIFSLEGKRAEQANSSARMQEELDKRYCIDNLFKIGDEKEILWKYEAYVMLRNHPTISLSLDEYAYLMWHTFENEKCPHLLNLKFQEEVSKYQKTFFATCLKSNDPDYLIKCYHYLKNSLTLQEIQGIEARLRDQYNLLPTTETKRDFLEKILFTKSISFDKKFKLRDHHVYSDFPHPDFKNWVVCQYTDIKSREFGVDNEEAAFAEKVEKFTTNLLSELGSGTAIAILERLASNVNAQKRVSYFIRDEIDKSTKSGLLKKGVFLGVLTEAGISAIVHSEDKMLRQATIEFLLDYDNALDLETYAVRLRKTLNRQKGFFDVMDAERLKLVRAYFRDLDFEKQILVIDEFLFPAEITISITKGKQYVFDQLFGSSSLLQMLANALTGNAVDKPKADKESRKIVESYLEALEEVAKNQDYKTSLEAREKLILSALLIANAKATAGNKNTANRGGALKQVLDAMGPAGRKLAQAIESHPQTPDDIKLALKSSKTQAAPPKRWEVIEWGEKYYEPYNATDSVAYMGEMLGSGSYGVTMAAKKQSGCETAITFLRPNVAEQARDEFMILDKLAKTLIRKNPQFMAFDDMQKEAAVSSVRETDMEIAVGQQKQAEKLYNDLVVTIEGHRFEFGVAEWIGSSDRYKETKIISGYHFNDLDQSEDLKHLKTLTAQAILAAELFILLKGGHFDNDRHGGQQKISKISDSATYIGNFDFGGMSLIPQTKWQKKMLGNIIGTVLWEVSKPGGSYLDNTLLERVIDKYVKEYTKKTYHQELYGNKYVVGDKRVKAFVGRTKRALLALGNYLSQLENDPDRLKVIIGAVLATGQIDPIIKEGMDESFGMFRSIVQSKLDELIQSKEVQTTRIGKPKIF